MIGEVEVEDVLRCDQDGCTFEGKTWGTMIDLQREVVFIVSCPVCGTEYETFVSYADMQSYDSES